MNQSKRKCSSTCMGGAGQDSGPADHLAGEDEDKTDIPDCVIPFGNLSPKKQAQKIGQGGPD